MSSSPTPAAAPPPRLTIPYRDGERDLFMSFALLNELANLVGGPENVPALSFDGGTTNTALELVLAKRDKRGKIIEEDEPAIPLDMSPNTGEAIIDWVAGHVLDFFIRRYAKSVALLAGQAQPLAAVGSSLTSSQNSAGKTA